MNHPVFEHKWHFRCKINITFFITKPVGNAFYAFRCPDDITSIRRRRPMTDGRVSHGVFLFLPAPAAGEEPLHYNLGALLRDIFLFIVQSLRLAVFSQMNRFITKKQLFFQNCLNNLPNYCIEIYLTYAANSCIL